MNHYFEIVSKSIERIKKNKKHIPFIGLYIHSLSEYIQYLFKYRKLLKKNHLYKDIHKGKRCFVIGNGPSLLKQDLKLLKNEFTITVNSMTSTKEFNIIKPDYHVIVDYVRFDENNKGIYENLSKLKKLKHKPTYVFPAKFKREVEKNDLESFFDIVYLHPHSRFRRFLSLDFQKRIPFFTNVTNVATLFAIYLGFSEIYLIGCDMTGIVKVYDENENFSSGGHFYNPSKKEKEYVKELQSNRTNEVFLSSYAHTFKVFRYIEEFAKIKGISIYNATKGGTLDVFRRVRYEDIFKK